MISPASAALMPLAALPVDLHVGLGALRTERRPLAWLTLFVAALRRRPASLWLVAPSPAWGYPPGTLSLSLHQRTWTTTSTHDGSWRHRLAAWRTRTVLALLALCDLDGTARAERDIRAALAWLARRPRGHLPAHETAGAVAAALSAAEERLGGRLLPDDAASVARCRARFSGRA